MTVELARILENDGWQPLWVPLGAEAEAMSAARPSARPTVLLVDDAETRTGMRGFLTDVAGGLSGPDLRVVLMARNSGEWWRELITSSGYGLSELLTAARPVRLRPVHGGAAQAEVFDVAVTEFASRLDVARPALRLTLCDPDASILILHAAALCAVLDHIEGAADEHPRSSANVLEDLLRHELKYCAQAAAARGLGLDPGAQRRVVAAACLIGADSELAVAGVLGRLPDFAGSAEQPGQVAHWLQDLYPGVAATGRRAAKWLGTMYPDRLAEHLIVGEFAAQPGLIPALFTGLDEPRAKEALTVLGRAAPNHPGAVPLLAHALAADLEHLALPALRVAVETNPVMDRLIADAVAAHEIPAQALERIAAAIPRRSFALAKTATAVLQRLADESPDGSAERQLTQ